MVNALNLSPAASLELTSALKRVWILPSPTDGHDRFASIPVHPTPGYSLRLAEKHTADGERLCALFDLLVSMSLQGFSPFPQNTTHLAQQVQKALEFPDRKRTTCFRCSNC